MLKSIILTNKMSDRFTAYLGLGGNVGDVIANMKSALEALNMHPEITVVKVSSAYKTPPWGLEEQDWFVNACVQLSTSLPAQELLELCLEIEKSHHRQREIRWGPRTLDLDILFYADHNIETDMLTLPHPRMHERAFVMQPLVDIAPKLLIREKTANEWLTELKDTQIEKLNLPDDWSVNN